MQPESADKRMLSLGRGRAPVMRGLLVKYYTTKSVGFLGFLDRNPLALTG